MPSGTCAAATALSELHFEVPASRALNAIPERPDGRLRGFAAVGVQPDLAVECEQHVLVVPAEEDPEALQRRRAFAGAVEVQHRLLLGGVDDLGEAVVEADRLGEDFVVGPAGGSRGGRIWKYGEQHGGEDRAPRFGFQRGDAGGERAQEAGQRRGARVVAGGVEGEEEPAAFGVEIGFG